MTRNLVNGQLAAQRTARTTQKWLAVVLAYLVLSASAGAKDVELIWNPDIPRDAKSVTISKNPKFSGPGGGPIVLGSDVTQGCYVDVVYSDAWTVTADPGDIVNAGDLPHGVYAKVVTGAQSVSATGLTGNWFTVSPAATPHNTPPNVVYWNKQPGTYYPPLGNGIPSGQQLGFRLHLTGMTGGTIKLELRELLGPSWPDVPDGPGAWSGGVILTFSKPQREYAISLDNCTAVPGNPNCYQVKAGFWGYLRVKTTAGDNPPPGSVVRWYKRGATSPCACEPFDMSQPLAWDPLGPRMTTVVSTDAVFPTNTLNACTCYVAVVNEGCFSYATAPVQINVCPSPEAIGALGATGTPTLQWVDGAYHACTEWQGTKLSFPAPGCCNYTAQWWKSTDDGASWNVIGTTTNQPELSIAGSIGHLVFSGTGCSKKYRFKVAISYFFCSNPQTATRELAIYIDKPTTPGTIVAYPWDYCGSSCPVSPYDNQHPVLCDGRATHLEYQGGCGRILRWEYFDGGVWQLQTDPVANQQSGWNTNRLWADLAPTHNSYVYRAVVKNGACPEQTSEITVHVKPKLTATIAGNTVICPGGSTILTATTSYDNEPVPPGYFLTYQWRGSGVDIQNATSKTYAVTQAGNYSVRVTDPKCGSATSNVLTVCVPAISISGPAAICYGCSFTLVASDNGCAPCGTYNWTGPGGFAATGPTITTTLPPGSTSGIYVVTNTCGGCPLIARFTVRVCP